MSEITLVLPYPVSAPGVYQIVDTKTGRFYVGSSVNVAKRWRQHRDRLARGSHPNPMLQALWNVDPDRLRIGTVQICRLDKAEILQAEQAALDAAGVGTNRMCMNVLPVAGSHLGRKRSIETCAALAADCRACCCQLRAVPEAPARLVKAGVERPARLG